MHALFLFKHSRAGDEELRFALRGIARHCPFIEKVWIFGDRPHFLTDDTCLAEQVPHDYVARVGRFRTPVRNTFLMLFLSSLLPELSPEFVFFNDDFLVLEPLRVQELRVQRYVEDLSQVRHRGHGLWKDALWRTYDTLRRLRYGTLNFENHVPTLFTKRQVLEAYLDLQDYVTEDRWYGLLAQTSILNHAYARQAFPVVKLAEEGKHIGFHHRTFTYDEIAAQCAGKTFLNFDDDAFDVSLRQYLHERFPEACQFERPPQTVHRTSKSQGLPSERSTHVLFALELGGGWGHIGVIQPLARDLAGQGHQITVAAPDLAVAPRMLEDQAISLIAAPAARPRGGATAIRTFAQVLEMSCFGDAAELTARCAAWQAIFQHVQPDVIVCDHAPSALLAARTTNARRVVLGQSFTLPDAVAPFPDWRPALGPVTEGLQNVEQQVLANVNAWLVSQNQPQLERLADLYHDADARILATLPELDSYAPRQAPADYYGVCAARGLPPAAWPDFPGKKVLAYLKPFRSLPMLLEQLRRLRAASVVICPGIDPKLAALCDGTRVHVRHEPVDLAAAAAECDLAIGHGTHGFTASLLLAGKPQLTIPLVLEQRLTAERVRDLGAGLVADPRQPKDVILKLRTVWEQPSYGEAAALFAARYREAPLTADPLQAIVTS